jgi:hypothetical protein
MSRPRGSNSFPTCAAADGGPTGCPLCHDFSRLVDGFDEDVDVRGRGAVADDAGAQGGAPVEPDGADPRAPAADDQGGERLVVLPRAVPRVGEADDGERGVVDDVPPVRREFRAQRAGVFGVALLMIGLA